MSMDEKVEMIEEMTQEALKVREENIVAEAIEAQRRGMFLLEGSQRVIEQLENDPQLVEMMRLTPIDPITIKEEINVSKSTQLEETTGLENLRVPSP
jgi:hypothetical protein